MILLQNKDKPVTPRKTASLERLMNRAFTQALFQGRQDVTSIRYINIVYLLKRKVMVRFF